MKIANAEIIAIIFLTTIIITLNPGLHKASASNSMSKAAKTFKPVHLSVSARIHVHLKVSGNWLSCGGFFQEIWNIFCITNMAATKGCFLGKPWLSIKRCLRSKHNTSRHLKYHLVSFFLFHAKPSNATLFVLLARTWGKGGAFGFMALEQVWVV